MDKNNRDVISAESSSRICVRVIFKITSIVFLGHRFNENFKMLNVRNFVVREMRLRKRVTIRFAFI